MRDYAKVSPKFWNGATGKALKAEGAEAVIVGLYLMTCQHANMLGLYYLNKAYIAVDTGLGLEGASKGLASACEVGFCHYDEDSEVVWVTEMALYQIDAQLEARDNRCKGVQREYDAVPENPFLAPFYERYGAAFHMTAMRGIYTPKASPSKAPPKPLPSQEQEQEQEQEEEQKRGKGAAAPPPPTVSPAPSPSPSPAPAPKPPRQRAEAPPAVERPEDVTAQTWTDWLFLRKKNKADVTGTVLSGARKEAEKAGMSLEQFLEIWCLRGSRGLQAVWLKPEERAGPRGASANEPRWGLNKQEALEKRNREVARQWVEEQEALDARQ